MHHDNTPVRPSINNIKNDPGDNHCVVGVNLNEYADHREHTILLNKKRVKKGMN